jgi:hypothetical protein
MRTQTKYFSVFFKLINSGIKNNYYYGLDIHEKTYNEQIIKLEMGPKLQI